MFIQLSHHKLDVFVCSQNMVIEAYRITMKLPKHELFGLVSQIRRAAVSVFLNVNEGCSRKSPAERKRFFEIARGSVVKVDSAIDISKNLGYMNDVDSIVLAELLLRTFQMLSRLSATT